MGRQHQKTCNQGIPGKKREPIQSSREIEQAVAIILSSLGLLICVLLFSWLTLDPGIITKRFLHYRPSHIINTAQMSGKVMLSHLETPLKGGIITVSHKRALINSDGTYTLPPIKPGAYPMTITHYGRLLHEETTLLKKGSNTRDYSIATIVADCMARNIPQGSTDEEIFKPIPPSVHDRGNPELKRVAITIDDGWFEDNPLLDLFQSYGIRCTVFIIGGRGIGDAKPHWIKKMDDMGFEVCNHTLDHSIITDLSDEKLEENLRQAQKNITNVTHKIYPYFRPPFGTYDKRTLDIAAKNGFKIILWTVSIKDTYRKIKVKQQVDYVLEHLQNGAIILAHFEARNTLEVMEELIPIILEKGYEIGTVSEVLEGLPQ
jgi:peptidoglycan/xylan/chitin deacetylase (PgdA/CDA1 family)